MQFFNEGFGLDAIEGQATISTPPGGFTFLENLKLVEGQIYVPGDHFIHAGSSHQVASGDDIVMVKALWQTLAAPDRNDPTLLCGDDQVHALETPYIAPQGSGQRLTDALTVQTT